MIRLVSSHSTVQTTHSYGIANKILLSDRLLSALVPFCASDRSDKLDHLSPLLHRHLQEGLSQKDLATGETSEGELLYEGPGWLAQGWRIVHHRSDTTGYTTDIEGFGRLHVDKDGHVVTYDTHIAALPQPQLAEILLGPGLILALALQGIFTLHASAVQMEGRLAAFVGESGLGKSTLARYLNDQPDWRRVTDDILPTRLEENTLLALPHFPQLKLPPDRQPAIGLPQQLPLSALFLLGAPTPEVEIKPLSPQQAAFALIRHTVASRLFAPDLLTRHLDFAQAAAQQVPAYSLDYPRQMEALPLVQTALSRLLNND